MQLQKFFPIDDRLAAAAEAAEKSCAADFARIEDNAAKNGAKVLAAFQKSRVSEPFFYGTTGYGYGDQCREVLDKVVATAFGTEDALVRHNFVSGTHALTVALFGILRTGDTMVSLTGRPYDSLEGVIGLNDDTQSGSLKNFGETYREVPLLKDGTPDYEADPDSVWKSEMFGRSLDNIVQEGIRGKLSLMPDNIRHKLQTTLTKVVNKGSNNMIAIVI